METKYYIDTKGLEDNATKEAMQFAKRLSEKDKNIERIVFLIHTKRNIDRFERYFGKDVTKELFYGKSVTGFNPILKIETKITYKQFEYGDSNDIVICFGLDDNDLFKIDDNMSAKYMIVIPWVQGFSDKWIQAWNAYNLRSTADKPKSVKEPNCIVKEALKELTGSINLSTGITHSMDEDLAKTYIKALHKYESFINPMTVYGYLIRELGWQSEHAIEIEKLIQTLNNGKYFKGGAKTGLKNYYNLWEKNCNK